MVIIGCVNASVHSTSSSPVPRYRVLVFSKTVGFRHSAIPDGIAAFTKLGAQHRFDVEATEDASVFNSRDLNRFAVVVFLNTTGDILNEDQQRAFQNYIAHGHGFTGVHAAADAEYEWPWYAGLVGAYFKGHPPQQEAALHVENSAFLRPQSVPTEWRHFDEWYNYRTNPRSRVHVLLTLDEKSYHGGTMGSDHPIAWFHRYNGGRAFYIGLGHTRKTYEDPVFLQYLLAGVEWAAGSEGK